MVFGLYSSWHHGCIQHLIVFGVAVPKIAKCFKLTSKSTILVGRNLQSELNLYRGQPIYLSPFLQRSFSSVASLSGRKPPLLLSLGFSPSASALSRQSWHAREMLFSRRLRSINTPCNCQVKLPTRRWSNLVLLLTHFILKIAPLTLKEHSLNAPGPIRFQTPMLQFQYLFSVFFTK
jgi:hypothetical protein